MNGVVSLFSGIGGLDRGLALAGWRHLLLCESSRFRRSVLRARFPGVPVARDVREVATGGGGRPVAGVVGGDGHRADPGRVGAWAEDGNVGLVAGGFPCQDLSSANNDRSGLDGDRSGLFFEFARVVGAVRPRWVLIENVPGLFTSDGGRDFGVVLGTLADLGYGLAWRTLDSRFFGVPQRRRRVFIVGAEAGGDPGGAARRAGEVLAVGTRCARHPATSGEQGEADEDAGAPVPGIDHCGPLQGRIGKGRGWTASAEEAAEGNLIAGESSVRRLTPLECERLQALPDGWTALGADSPRYAALGDAVTATVAQWIGERILTFS